MSYLRSSLVSLSVILLVTSTILVAPSLARDGSRPGGSQAAASAAFSVPFSMAKIHGELTTPDNISFSFTVLDGGMLKISKEDERHGYTALVIALDREASQPLGTAFVVNEFDVVKHKSGGESIKSREISSNIFENEIAHSQDGYSITVNKIENLDQASKTFYPEAIDLSVFDVGPIASSSTCCVSCAGYRVCGCNVSACGASCCSGPCCGGGKGGTEIEYLLLPHAGQRADANCQ